MPAARRFWLDVTIACASTAVMLAMWFRMVGWDLSTVDQQDRVFRQYKDVFDVGDIGRLAFAVGVITFVASLVHPRLGVVAGLCATATIVLFGSWRMAAARVAGANLWPLGTIYIHVMLGGAWLICLAGGVAVRGSVSMLWRAAVRSS